MAAVVDLLETLCAKAERARGGAAERHRPALLGHACRSRRPRRRPSKRQSNIYKIWKEFEFLFGCLASTAKSYANGEESIEAFETLVRKLWPYFELVYSDMSRTALEEVNLSRQHAAKVLKVIDDNEAGVDSRE